MRVKKGNAQPGQKIAYSDKGMISIIPPSRFTNEQYEIYCLDGNLFDDIERYDKENEALERCKNLLDCLTNTQESQS